MRKSIVAMLMVAFMPFGFCLLSFAEDSAGMVKQANNLYRQKKYDEAIKLYNEAQIKSPDAAEINYNIGIAEYRKEDYNQAINYLEKATASKDKTLESEANFNIGNSKYKLGKLKENTELKETVNLLRQSLDYYKRAIELNAKDEDARINHELVERELKILLDKLKHEQDKQKKQSGQQEKEKKEGQGQSQSGEQEKKQDGQEQKQQAAQAEKQKTGEQKEEGAQQAEEAKQAEEQKQNQAEESKGQAAEEAKEMSKQEANMLLEGYRQEESSAGKLEDRKRGSSENVLKDW